MIEEKATEPDYITWEQLRRETNYLREDIENLKKKIKFLVAILVDKKLIGEQVAKSFSESKTDVPKEIQVIW